MRRFVVAAAGALVAVAATACLGGHSHGTTTSTPSTSSHVLSVPASTTAPSSKPPTVGAQAPSSPQAPPTFQSMFDADRSGIVRIDARNCDGGDTGSGFLIGPNLIATVGHVVAGADDIRVTDPVLGTTYSAVVLGSTEDNQDLALLQTPASIPGHVFTLDTTEPAVSASMVVVGFSRAGPEHVSDGLIESIHQRTNVPDGTGTLSLSDQALTSAATNGGDSGGPWLDVSGLVLALTDDGYEGTVEGENGGVPAADAAPLFTNWQNAAMPSPMAAAGCAPKNLVEAANVTLTDYFYDIDMSDYASAYAQETVATSSTANLDEWIDGVETSQDGLPENFASDGTVIGGPYYTLNGDGIIGGVPYLDVAFRTTQDGAHGTDKQTCTDWSLRYRFAMVGGVPLIDSALKVPGAAYDEQQCPVATPSPAVNGSAPGSPDGSVLYSPAATAS
jgi:serine protease Do